MTDTEIYQNIDNPKQNPLNTQPVLDPSTPPPSKIPLALPHDPRIIALIVLALILIVLTFIALVVKLGGSQSNKIPAVKLSPTLQPAQNLSPTLNPQKIPLEYLDKFNQIDREIKVEEDFLPPKIDTETGL